ncbi:MAG: hypothetical protein ACK5ES_15320, partial [Planctomyces sp.]
LRMAAAKSAASSDRGAEFVRSGETASIVALRGAFCCWAGVAVSQRQSLCLESYPVRPGDDGKRVAG